MSWTDLARNGRILVVDDAMENIQILHHALREEHEVLFALDGEQALQIARDQQPDLILLDAVMPGMDGYAVVAALRGSPRLQDIPVIFVTALSRPEDETRALEAGAVDFISKPFNVAVVRARVRSQLTIKRQADAMRELSMTDGLTGVANRRNFNDTVDAEWRRCARAGLPLSVIMIDIDHFKLYNDHYGHQAGDGCLQDVSAAMKRCATRPQDMLARYGGEEFILLLPQEGADGTEVVANRILDEVRKLALPHAASVTAPHVTLSMGLATVMPQDSSDPHALIRTADANLYRAKQTGRNRYCISLDS
ncbi:MULTISPECIES: diguanylate cyclase domain-containing protein [unclassified Duganella]|jgi:diguanylate cyclase (GGDEF)-like protein|uniref:diguanylate cyclase domain-containing protein n=1 Tax=unclassified Duganella TaxID=2636909 RepID=UPI000886F548|nr:MULTISPECIES: diguanylate cyclase [unclassified Duganella]SDG54448.1 diguanylate cyclase (GGDEF) domain-containing protein [Duganella sp. OV458]SDJ77071.1 response regulator receiver modulated diguanylate cyclase [Duganella sp. OV510]